MMVIQVCSDSGKCIKLYAYIMYIFIIYLFFSIFFSIIGNSILDVLCCRSLCLFNLYTVVCIC